LAMVLKRKYHRGREEGLRTNLDLERQLWFAFPET